MDERLDLVGEMLVLLGQGHGHLQLEFEGEGRTLTVDGPEGDDSLEAVGLAHGESPYGHYFYCYRFREVRVSDWLCHKGFFESIDRARYERNALQTESSQDP
jgi:hypothetical protein